MVPLYHRVVTGPCNLVLGAGRDISKGEGTAPLEAPRTGTCRPGPAQGKDSVSDSSAAPGKISPPWKPEVLFLPVPSKNPARFFLFLYPISPIPLYRAAPTA